MSDQRVLNGSGDLGIDAEIRWYIDERVTLIKICKSGLYQIKTQDGKLFSVPKRNLETLKEYFMRLASPLRYVDLSGWTIEPAQDLMPQYGLDLEKELIAALCRM